MRIGWVVGAVLLQIAALGYMAGEREAVLRTGQTVYLRTAPVDPRDVFRGDYVTLQYDLNRVERAQWRDGLAAWPRDRQARPADTRVYAVLRPGDDGLAALEYLSDRRPDGGLFLRGRTARWSWGDAVNVRYGIEAYFVEQDKGRLLEDGRRRGEFQVPLDMAVAVGASGIGVLKGYRWCTLGINLKLESDKQNRVVRGALQLLNASDRDLAVLDLPDSGSLRLVQDRTRGWSQKTWTWLGEGSPRPAPDAATVHVLKPGETYAFDIDFNDAHWYVRCTDAGGGKDDGAPRALTGLNQGELFRMVYAPPPVDVCRDLAQADLVWHGELRSRSFNGGGRVD